MAHQNQYALAQALEIPSLCQESLGCCVVFLSRYSVAVSPLTALKEAVADPATESVPKDCRCCDLLLKGCPIGMGTGAGGARKNSSLKSPSKLGRNDPSLPDDSETSELRLSNSNAVEWPELR